LAQSRKNNTFFITQWLLVKELFFLRLENFERASSV
jgi:hypothetical protein